MKMLHAIRAGLGAVGLALAGAADADLLTFTGALNATAGVVPDPACAPLLFRGTVLAPNGIGTSSLGDFSYSHSVCHVGASGPVTGTFAIDFGTDGFAGLLNGTASASATPGLFNQNFTYTINSGTGRFLGAIGAFSGIGTVDARNPPSRLSLVFDGAVNAPVVPEPASWALCIAGFGLVGAGLRRRGGGARPAFA